VSAPPLAPGDPVPWLRLETVRHGVTNLEAFGGYRVGLFVFGSLADAGVEQIWRDFLAEPAAFSNPRFQLVGVCTDRTAVHHPVFAAIAERFVVAMDDGFALCDAFGLRAGAALRRETIMIDERVILRARVAVDDARRHVAAVRAALDADFPTPRELHAPILILPGVLSPTECAQLIAAWHADHGERSGYMTTDASGRPLGVIDSARKRRKDCYLAPQTALYDHVADVLRRRVSSQIRRFFQFDVLAAERLLVACYDAEDGGHFRKHRDFYGPGSHREFGLTINLNDGFGGGALDFPEFAGARYTPNPGDALVYSGALVHRVEPVTTGVRFCLLSFLYGARGKAVLDRLIAEHGRSFATVVVDG
jgi:peroxiredoxin/predicted 2-oxoglutarate/Fe(II)-dependent dioxygenase YbiX